MGTSSEMWDIRDPTLEKAMFSQIKKLKILAFELISQTPPPPLPTPNHGLVLQVAPGPPNETLQS